MFLGKDICKSLGRQNHHLIFTYLGMQMHLPREDSLFPGLPACTSIPGKIVLEHVGKNTHCFHAANSWKIIFLHLLNCPPSQQSSAFGHSIALPFKQISSFPEISNVKTPIRSAAHFLSIRVLWGTNKVFDQNILAESTIVVYRMITLS